MTMNTNDPRLTAYALGEANAKDQAAVEAALRESPELQGEIDAIRQVGKKLATGFDNEHAPLLDQETREQIVANAARTLPFVPAATRQRWLAAAAVMTLLVGSITLLQPNREEGTRPVFINVSTPEPIAEQQPEVRPEPPKPAPVDNEEIVKDVPPAPPKPVPAPEPVTFDAVAPVRSPLVMRKMQVSRNRVSHMMSPGMPAKPASTIAPSLPPMEEAPMPNGFVSLDTEEYDLIRDNPFCNVVEHPLSTFSIDVDTASYANIRRMLNQGTMPPPDAVRIEEMINYFHYDYAVPDDRHPFAAHLAMTISPWRPDHQLVRIGIKARELGTGSRPAMNLVFLLDVSGSMDQPNKLPLVKRALKMLVQHLDERDRIAIVVYAGASGLVLPSTACDNDQAILDALDRLAAGGSTNGGAGIELAYATALKHLAKNGGVNRVILCTDGDFNVGTVQTGDLVRLVEQKAKDGIFLSVLGFGMGNYKDATLEQLADKGNGNYAYIDTFKEARRVLVDQLTGTLVTVAKDVKIQVEFNPAHVAGYRLIGYENRMLNKEDFNDDTKDAGDIGAGHTVTALYEIVPAGRIVGTTPAVDDLRYQTVAPTPVDTLADEIMTVKIRYKAPDSDKSTPLAFPLRGRPIAFEAADEDVRFASAVAAFGMLLRDSPHKGDATYERVLDIALKATGSDRHGYRREFIDLVRNAKALTGKPSERLQR